MGFITHRKSAGTLVLALVFVTVAKFVTAASSIPMGLISPLWERLVPNNWPPRSGAPGLVLSDLLRTSDGRLIALGKVDDKPSLFVDPDVTGPGKIIPLAISGDRLRFAEGNDGILWIGGFKNEHYEGFGSSLVSEAYLVKLDTEGRIIWERSFGTDTQRTIESLASLPSGSVVVSGRDRWTNWLAMISPQGQIEWERFMGVAGDTSVSVARDNIFLAGLDAGHADGSDYQEDVVLWSLDIAGGNVLDRRIVRDRVTTAKNLFLGTIKIRHSAEAIYVFSSGIDHGLDVPIEVAKLGYDSKSYWRTTLAQTVQTRPRGGTFSCPAPGSNLLDNGDPLIACAIGDQANLFRIGSLTGDAKQTSMRLPPCHHGFAAALFLSQTSPHSLRILGTRPESVYQESCTWLGTISVAN